MDQSMFELFGGDGQISDLIDQFYYKVLFDQSLRSMFLKADMTRVRLQQKTFFAQMFGCVHTKYTGKDLVEVHKNLSITDQQFDRFLYHLKCILADMNKPQELIDSVLKRVDSHRHVIVFK